MSGVRIGKAPIPPPRKQTLLALRLAPSASFAAGRGTASRRTAVWRFATASHPAIAAATLPAFATPSLGSALPGQSNALRPFTLLPFAKEKAGPQGSAFFMPRPVNVLLRNGEKITYHFMAVFCPHIVPFFR